MLKISITQAIILFTVGICCICLTVSELQAQANEYFKPIPKSVPIIKDNPITSEKIELGKMLYFDQFDTELDNISKNSFVFLRPKW